MSEPLRLPEKWSIYLAGQPETGMDYHTGDVVLKDGTLIHDVAFIGSTYIGEIRSKDNICFDPKDILEIRLTHNRWNYKK